MLMDLRHQIYVRHEKVFWKRKERESWELETVGKTRKRKA